MFTQHTSRKGLKIYEPTNDTQAPTLPPGVYKAGVSFGGLVFEELPIVSDELMELDSPEYHEVLDHMKWFLADSTEGLYKEHGYLYKTGILLWGDPGTGKTSLVSRVSDSIVGSGGVVIYCADSAIVKSAVEEAPKDKLVTIVLEEVDTMHDGHLLSILDGEVQRDRIIFLATTNYRERITPRLLRPSRLGKKVEVKFPNVVAREQFFTVKLGGNQIVARGLALQTDKLSVDDLKHVHIMTAIQGMSTEDAVREIRKEKTR